MHIDIEYCVPCGLRDHAVDLQAALLDEYGRELEGVQLTPGHGGVFRVTADGETVWNKDEAGGIDAAAIVDRVGE